jgi:hypothetical protein
MHNQRVSALVGYTGFVGSKLVGHIEFAEMYGQGNIDSICGKTYDLVICAAPTGNRLEVESDPGADLMGIKMLVSNLEKTNIKQFVLISTIDTIVKPHTNYGMNRAFLEDWVKQNFDNHSIIRMPSLIHCDIKKNQLFDLKNKCYLEKINRLTTCQYYDLTNLVGDVNFVIDNKIEELNLFSEPISNAEILSKFYPDLIVGQSASTAQYYDVNPYRYSKSEILKSIEKYFNE